MQKGTSCRAVLAVFVFVVVAGWLGLGERDARGEKLSFVTYRGETLPSRRVLSLHQDRRGLLWLGTEGGLARYDGDEVATFAAREGVNAGPILAITEDGEGRIWAAGMSGLAAQRGDRFETYTEADGLPGALIADLVGTADGVLVAARYPGGAARVSLAKGAAKPVVQVLDVLPHGASFGASQVQELADGTTLFGTRGQGLLVRAATGTTSLLLPKATVFTMRTLPGRWAALVGTDRGLFRYEAGAVAAVSDDGGLATSEVRSLYRTPAGVIFAGTESGRLYRIDEAARTTSSILEGASNGAITELAMDPTGTLWGCVFEHGVLRLRPGDKSAIVVEARRGFPSAQALALAVDRNGIVFVGTSEGLVRVAGSEAVTYDVADGLPSSTVWSVTRGAGPARDLIFGTDLGLAIVGQRTITVSRKEGLPSGTVFQATTVDACTLLAATKDGLARVRFCGAKVDVETFDAHWLSSVLRTPAGRFFVGGEQGVGEVVDHRIVDLPIPGLRAGDRVFDLAAGQDERLWIATARGLFLRTKEGNVVTFSRRDGLKDDDLTSAFEAQSGAVWVSYTKSLGATELRFPRGEARDPSHVSVRHFGVAEGLPSDNVYGFAEATRSGPSRGLWFGTAKGVLHLREDGTRTRYARANGLPSEDVAQNSLYVDDDDSIWFGTVSGAVQLRPDLTASPRDPEAWLTRTTLGGAAAEPFATVAYARRDFEARFSSLLFEGEDAATFRHRLLGYRDEWSPFGGDHVAMFSNLPPGSYTFEVEVRSEKGRLSAAPAAYAFHVLPPFYLTVGFRFAVAVGALLVAAALVQVGRASLARRNRILETKVERRTLELRQKLAELDVKNAELADVNDRLVLSQARADRIFSALSDALPGTVIDGKYRLEERIASGGSGVVFRSTHLDLHRAIAVKIFKPAPGSDSAEALERFRREGEAASRIEHPNAVQIFDSGISSDGLAYIVMQLLEGNTLEDELRKEGPLSLDRVRAITLATGGVLECIHSLGIVHRDIKPDNVILHHAPEGEVIKVIDFGIAKVIDSQEGLTQEGTVVGTPAYMAPERFGCDEDVGPKSDVYALGALVFRMLTGGLPFQGSLNEIISGHMMRDPPNLAVLRPDLDAEIVHVVMASLAKDASERPNATTFVAAFQ